MVWCFWRRCTHSLRLFLLHVAIATVSSDLSSPYLTIFELSSRTQAFDTIHIDFRLASKGLYSNNVFRGWENRKHLPASTSSL